MYEFGHNCINYFSNHQHLIPYMQLMVRCLRVPNVGTRIDTQLILEVFENELKVEGFLKETTCEVPNTESKGGAVFEKEKKLRLGERKGIFFTRLPYQ